MRPYFAILSLLTTSSPSVDTVRQSLIARSDRWFFWLVVSSIVVGVGVCLEGPEATIALKRWYLHWKHREVLPENARSLAIPASYLGLLLVLLGVAGEGVFESLSSNAETALRAHDEQVLADTITEAGAAKGSASAAAVAAKTAGEQSSHASTSASNARILATGARQEADSFKQDITDAKQQAADAVSRLADAENRLADATQRELAAEVEVNRLKTPRSLVDTDKLIAALKPFSGTEYMFNVFLEDEANQFTKVVAGALDAAGWVRKQPTGINIGIPTMKLVLGQGPAENVPACVETGVSLHAHTKESLAVLQSTPVSMLPKTVQAAIALKSAIAPSISPPDERNVADGIIDPEPREGIPLTICIGKKP
jgi:hypothetical protein